MRKLAMFAASALALGTISATPAWADHAEDDGHDDLVVLATVTEFDKQDDGEEGPSAGDSFRYKADLADKEGEDTGHSKGKCVLTDGKDGGDHGDKSSPHHGKEKEHSDLVAQCVAGFALDEGELFISGCADKDDFEDGKVSFPVMGGKGKYEDAEGKATVKILHHGEGKDHGEHHAVSRPADHGDEGEDGGHHDGPHFKVTFDFE